MSNDEAQLRAALDLIHADSPLIEVRPIMPDGRWWSAFYDDREALIRSVLGLNALQAPAVYWSLNAIKPTLANRVTNSLAPARRNGCLKNADIDRIRWLFLDIDPKGEATVQELASDVRRFLSAHGWEPPVTIDSGNGMYLLYRCDLPLSDHKTIKAVVKNLAERFDRAGAIIDRKCANPARIARIPGTFNRKATPRMATVLEAA